MGLWVSCNYDMNQHVLCSAWIDIHSRSEAVYDCTIESMIHSLRERSYGSCDQVIDHQDIHGFVVPLTEQSVLPLRDSKWCSNLGTTSRAKRITIVQFHLERWIRFAVSSCASSSSWSCIAFSCKLNPTNHLDRFMYVSIFLDDLWYALIYGIVGFMQLWHESACFM